MKSVHVQRFYRLYIFPHLNVERYSVSLHIQSDCGKIWTRKTPNTDTFHVALVSVSVTISNMDFPIIFI